MMMSFEWKLPVIVTTFCQLFVWVGMYIHHSIVDVAMYKIRYTAQISYIQ